MELPFNHFYKKQDPTNAVSDAWELDISLGPERPIKFLSLLILNDGPVDNDKIVRQLSERMIETIRYQQHILEGNKVSVTNEDFFEQSLQKINSEISNFLRDIQIPLPVQSWAIVITMLAKDESEKRLQFFISRFGEVAGWLLNNAQLETKKLISIFDAPDALPPNQIPQKFFVNTLSSVLPKNDQLFFCSPNLLNYVGLGDIKTILSTLSVTASLKQLENQIEFRPTDHLVTALTLRLAPYPVVEKTKQRITDKDAETSMEDLMSTQSQTDKLLGTSFGLNAKQIKGTLVQGLNRIKSKVARSDSEIIPSQSSKRRQSAFAKVASSGLKGSAAVFSGTKSIISRLSSPKSAKSIRKKKHLRLLTTNQTITKVAIWKKQLLKLTHPIKQLFPQKKSLKILKHPAFYIFIVVAVVVSLSLKSRQEEIKSNEVAVSAAQEQISEITANLNRIDSYLIVGRESDAIVLAQTVQDLLNSVDPLPEIAEDIDALRSDLKERQSKLRKESIIDQPIVIAADLQDALDTAPKGLTIADGHLIIVGQNPRSVMKISLEDGSSNVFTVTTDLNDWTSVGAIDATELLFLNEKSLTILDFEDDSGATTVLDTESAVRAVTFFNTRLYTLSPDSNQILRSNNAPDYTALSNWITSDSISVKNARDLAIDGSILVLSSNSITTLSKGKLAEDALRLKPIEPPMTDAQKIWTDADVDLIYILEPTRLIVFEKEGAFKGQYTVPNIGDFLDMAVDHESKSVYLLTADKLVKVGI